MPFLTANGDHNVKKNDMNVKIALSTILVSCLMSANAQEVPDQTMTIYFTGTTMVSDMYQAASTPFFRPETVATLHYLQKAGADYPGHHKGIVSHPEPWSAWGAKSNIAIELLKPVTDLCAVDTACVTLNLVGFSRGAVLTMYTAYRLANEEALEDTYAGVRKINILAFDPVPGDPFMGTGYFNLASNVDYLAFYSLDERSAMFSPVFPNAPPASANTDPLFAMFTVPGSHETMIGNTLINGHRNTTQDNDSLDHTSRMLKVMATEIMGAANWGSVRFASSDIPELSVDWYEDETDLDVLRQSFVAGINDIYAAPYPDDYYRNMHNYSFLGVSMDNILNLGLLETWFEFPILGEYCRPAIGDIVTPLGTIPGNVHRPRCVYYQPDGYSGTLWTSDAPIYDVADAEPLNTMFGVESVAWNLILDRGSLDVDADLFDYRDDNCPVTQNFDQLDADVDMMGDACDTCTDTDFDGFGDPGFAANSCALDNCPLVDNADQADFDNDGIGDVCDADKDNDGVTNEKDMCPFSTMGSNGTRISGCFVAMFTEERNGGGSASPLLLTLLSMMVLAGLVRHRKIAVSR